MWFIVIFCAVFYYIGWAIAAWIRFSVILFVSFIKLCVVIARKVESRGSVSR